ncbi:MAG: hypothetical protein RML95_10020 [Anaerolineae bacterium]|nr:hypothetical protein [Anaerolineae bacterium]MDW8299661.1 hypothetical protein [Anaerolineae bacterium]
MIRLILVVIALSLVLSALINTARSSGSSQPLTLDQLFTGANGEACASLCMLGVTPSQTSFVDANRLVRQHPLVRGQLLTERVNGNLVELIGVDITVVLLRGRRNELALISIHTEPFNTVILPAERFSQNYVRVDSLGTLGDVLARFGTPARVLVPRRSTNMMRLFYPQHSMVITSQIASRSGETHVRTSDQVQYIGISALEQYRDAWQGLTLSATAWHGFSRAVRYLQTSRQP